MVWAVAYGDEMNEKQESLLKAVKTAVAKYGLSGVTTRNVAEIAQVNDAYIYHFFKDKEDLLLQAYCYENGRIFQSILYAIDKVSPLSQSFREKARMCFQRIWKTMLSDPERLTFCVFYYHSAHFKNAEEYHNGQLEELHKRLGEFFPNKEVCSQTMYAVCTLLYDSAYSVVSGQEEDTEAYAERVLEMESAVIESMMDNKGTLCAKDSELK